MAKYRLNHISLATDSCQDVIVGVNKYQLDAKQEEEERQEVLQIDNSAVRKKQVDRLLELKRTRNEDDVTAALAALEASARLESSTSKGWSSWMRSTPGRRRRYAPSTAAKSSDSRGSMQVKSIACKAAIALRSPS